MLSRVVTVRACTYIRPCPEMSTIPHLDLDLGPTSWLLRYKIYSSPEF